MINLYLLTNVSAVMLHVSSSHDHLAPILAGTFAAILHVVSGPDHLAAVTPLAIETRRRVWKIGLLWGVGHLMGMLLIGLLFLLFKEHLPLEQISIHSEQLVGVVLIAVGLWALFSIFNKTNRLKNSNQLDNQQSNIHGQKSDVKSLIYDPAQKTGTKKNQWSSLWIGVLHGLAGIAHFILLLPVLGFENQWDSIQYIFGFGLGTVFAMTIYTSLLGRIAIFSKNINNQSFHQTLRLSASLFAIVIGIYWIYLSI